MEHPTEPIVSAPVVRKSSRTSSLSNEKVVDPEMQLAQEVAHDEADIEDSKAKHHAYYLKLRPFILGGLAAVILGWWITSTILKATRHRW